MTKVYARKWRTWSRRSANRWMDVRARLAGYCNDRPWRPEPGTGGGYADWRCALRRRHDGLHRFNNYVWGSDGRTDYVPALPGGTLPHQPWRRHMVGTRRDCRARERWHVEETARIRARRSAGERA